MSLRIMGFMCIPLGLANLLMFTLETNPSFINLIAAIACFISAILVFTVWRNWKPWDERGSIGIGWLIAIGVAVMLVIPLGVWGFRVVTAPIKGAGDQRIQTNEVNYRIAAYDRFFNLCSAVKSQESNILHLTEELNDTVNPPTVERKNQLLTFITASKNQRSELINQYNADATKEGTAGQFQASTLPYQINEGGTTVCVIS